MAHPQLAADFRTSSIDADLAAYCDPTLATQAQADGRYAVAQSDLRHDASTSQPLQSGSTQRKSWLQRLMGR